jgi:predicted Zn-dependent protease
MIDLRGKALASCVGLLCLGLAACAIPQKPVAYQAIPPADIPSAEETAFGERVFRSLAGDHAVDAGSDRRALLDEITTELLQSAGLDPEDWHVHLLHAPEIADLRSVEGNYLFVWSGLFDIVKSDDELAGLLACEIAHALADHTDPVRFTPTTELLFEITDIAASIGLIALTQGAVNISGVGLSRWIFVEANDLDPLDRVYTKEQLQAMAMIAALIIEGSRYQLDGLLAFWRRAGSEELPLDPNRLFARTLPTAQYVSILEEAVQQVRADRTTPDERQVDVAETH